MKLQLLQLVTDLQGTEAPEHVGSKPARHRLLNQPTQDLQDLQGTTMRPQSE
jgi:hypothetical protein